MLNAAFLHFLFINRVKSPICAVPEILLIMSLPSFSDETAAQAVITILKRFPEFANAKTAIIGGLSLWKDIREYRFTEMSIS